MFSSVDLKTDYLNPFVQSVYDVFSTMLRAEASRVSLGVADRLGGEEDVVTTIGLSGPARGTVAMIFPVPTALAVTSRFTGLPAESMDDTATDAMSELVNMVAGGAKAKLIDGKTPINLGLPTVIQGEKVRLAFSSRTRWLDVSFSSELGPFSLRVAFEVMNGVRKE